MAVRFMYNNFDLFFFYSPLEILIWVEYIFSAAHLYLNNKPYEQNNNGPLEWTCTGIVKRQITCFIMQVKGIIRCSLKRKKSGD